VNRELADSVAKLMAEVQTGTVKALAITWQTDEGSTWALRWRSDAECGDMHGLLASLEMVKKEILDGFAKQD
jgi:hypothetical protein